MFVYPCTGAIYAAEGCRLHLLFGSSVTFSVNNTTSHKVVLQLNVLQMIWRTFVATVGGSKERFVKYVIEALSDRIELVGHVVEF